jgi:DNA-3-methyladenine glycosylase II
MSAAPPSAARESSTFRINATGPFSLASSIRFLEGFTPAAYDEPEASGHLHLAFVVDGTEQAVGVCARAQGGGILGEVFGKADREAVRAQVARILSLDVDGSGLPAVGLRDPVVGGLQAHYPGLRPVCFVSPYDAAAWTIIGRRIRVRQAARLKARMAEELGASVVVPGEQLHAFPPPSVLRDLSGFGGLTEQKLGWLRAVARAAEDGRLDTARLRALPVDQALAELQALPGIGPFSAELILLRGAGEPDHLALHEPRLRRAVARAYGLHTEPTDEELQHIAEGWRPYRTWVTLLLRAKLEEDTREIAGRRT